jgi:hypothetical protein
MSKRVLHIIVVVLAISQLLQWGIFGASSLHPGRAQTVSAERFDRVDSERFPVASFNSRRTTYTDGNNVRHTQDEPVIELGYSEGSLLSALTLQDDVQRGPEMMLLNQKQNSVIKLAFDDAGMPALAMADMSENGVFAQIGIDKRNKTLVVRGKNGEIILSLKLEAVNRDEPQVVIWSNSKQPVVIKERK